MKAGTSSYAYLLGQHPDIYIPEQELHFFSTKSRWKADPPRPEEYERLFPDWKGEHWVGEKTPTYSYSTEAPKRIAAWIPDVKLVWLFREPVARAYSHHEFFRTRGQERLSFKHALQREKSGKTLSPTMRYIDRSIYSTQVEHYLKYFPKEQMLFLLFEEFIAQTPKTLQTTAEFFDLDLAQFLQIAPPHKNKTNLPRSPLVEWLVARVIKRRQSSIRKFVSKVNRRLGPGKYPRLAPELRAELTEFYRPYNERLAALTGLDLSLWGK